MTQQTDYERGWYAHRDYVKEYKDIHEVPEIGPFPTIIGGLFFFAWFFAMFANGWENWETIKYFWWTIPCMFFGLWLMIRESGKYNERIEAFEDKWGLIVRKEFS